MLCALRASPPAVVAAPEAEFLPSAEGESHPHGPAVTHVVRATVPARLRFLEALGPLTIVAGVRSSGGRPYIAFIFPHVVVLECDRECNALYLFAHADGWKDLAQTGKLDLIRKRPPGFIRRIVHKGDWQGRTRNIVQSA